MFMSNLPIALLLALFASGATLFGNIYSSLNATFGLSTASDFTSKIADVLADAGNNDYNSFGTPETFVVAPNMSFNGIGVGTNRSGAGGFSESISIRGLLNQGSTKTVDISVRSKAFKESIDYLDQTPGNHEHSNDSPIGHSPLVGNVFKISGMGIEAAAADGRVRADPFVLEATYLQEDYDLTRSLPEIQELRNGCLFIGWLYQGFDGTPGSASDQDRWVNAVQGNFANMPDNPNRSDEHAVIGQAFEGSFDEYFAGTETCIAGVSKAANSFRVGDWGGDVDNNTLWVAIDHNSQFAVIPETKTYALLLGLGVLLISLKKRK